MNTWQPSLRTPDPAVRILDKRFEHYRLAHAKVERLWTGCRWAEGPVWFGDAGVLYWTDLPNDRILKWDEATEAVSTWRAPSSKANGMTRDRQGRLIVCEHGTRRVTRTEYDGRVNRKLGRGRVLIDAKDGTPDGFRVDVDGNLWCGWGTGSEELDGVRIFAPDGTAIGHIALPERCANLCFGGTDNNRLFMASTTSLYALFVNTRGAV